MIKVAFIGAGSVVFARNLTGDILGVPEFRTARLSYMDIDRARLDVAAALAQKTAYALGATPHIEATQDLGVALDGADFVINMIQVGGFDGTLIDFEIPRKFGLLFTIADTTGPGGLFRALRTYPALKKLAEAMRRHCPRALLLNYSNPMSMNMRALVDLCGANAIGLCHSVQGTLETLARYLNEPTGSISYTCAGINHMAFFLRLEKDGVGLYPRLREAARRPEVYNSNRVRFELLDRLGCFVTESSEHNAEYSAHFIPPGVAQRARFNVPIDEYLRRCEYSETEFERMRELSRGDATPPVCRSYEYGITILEAMVLGRSALVYGNLPNRGAIANLPGDTLVEAPTRVDRSGPHFETVGELPPRLLEYIQPHLAQHELFLRALTHCDRDAVYQAAMIDPLTAATLSRDATVQMCDELVAAHGDALPPLPKAAHLPVREDFPRVNPAELRRLWKERRVAAARNSIHEWRILGPFHSPLRGDVNLEIPTSFEADFHRRRDGTVDVTLDWPDGVRRVRWQTAHAGELGFVNLAEWLGACDWSMAYAYAEVQSASARETELRCGSDDGIRVWLNGVEIHTHQIRRPYWPGADVLRVSLDAGVNRVLVKIDNAEFGWGFGVQVD